MSTETGSRARTRQAILDAAIVALGRHAGTPLAEIAAAAGVGRTTLHRYFPDRADLLAAVATECRARIRRAVELARLPDGPGSEALLRLAREYFDLGDLLTLIFADPQLLDFPSGSAADACDPDLEAVIVRGHRDGTVDPELPPAWVQSLIWSQLYAGWAYVSDSGASRHDALRLVLRTLRGALTPPTVH